MSAEAVAEGGGEGPGAAEGGVLSFLEFRLPRPEAGDEVLDILGGSEVFAQSLADEDGDGKGVPGGVAQQRPPVRSGDAVVVAFGQGGGQLEAFPHRHGRQPDPGRDVAEPVALVTAGGEQHFAPGPLG